MFANKKVSATILLTTLFLLFLLSSISIDLYTPALPAINEAFQVSNKYAQFTISLFILGLGIGNVSFGIIIDCFKRRHILAIALFGFIMSSLLIVFASHIYTIIILRLIQGFCCSATTLVPRAILLDLYHGNNFKRKLGWMVSVWATGPIIAPFVGGYIQHYFNWHAIFYALALYGIFTFLLLIIFIPETLTNTRPLNLKEIGRNYYHIFSNKLFLLCLMTIILSYTTIIIFNIIGPFVLQNKLGYNAEEYGKISLLLGIGFFLGSSINAYSLKYKQAISLAKHWGIWFRIIISLIMLGAALVVKTNFFIVFIPTFLIFFSLGFYQSNSMAAALKMFPSLGSQVNAIVGPAFILGSGILSTIVSTINLKSTSELALIFFIFSAISFAIFPAIKRLF